MMIRDVILFCQRSLALWLYNVTNESYFLKGKIVQIQGVLDGLGTFQRATVA